MNLNPIPLHIGAASSADLTDCAAALVNSDLGAHHFPDEQTAYKTVRYALRHEQLHVARTADGTCAGFIWIIPRGAFFVYPYIHIVAVCRPFRGRGIGTQLLHYAEQTVSADKLFLEVDSFNPRAKALYERLGYQTVGELPELFEHGVTGFLMMKSLGPREQLQTSAG